MNLIMVYSAITALGLLFMVLKPSLLAGEIGALAVGFFTAGGVWQVGLSVLTSYFPRVTEKLLHTIVLLQP
ncbi:hypothetical protein SDC49_20535 [Lactobacillus sp. R2/2]|nr:hypothetical protein [Lactobacillus sp. R2/2]